MTTRQELIENLDARRHGGMNLHKVDYELMYTAAAMLRESDRVLQFQAEVNLKKIAELDQTIARQAEALKLAGSMLLKASLVFGNYALHHADKSPPDTEKAERNQKLSDEMNEALAAIERLEKGEG